jgi:hypothetical protein
LAPFYATDTFGGKNTPTKIATDATNIDAAAERGAADIIKIGEESGNDFTKAADELLKLQKDRTK